MDNLNRKAELLVKKHARRRLLQRAVAVPAAVVVFVTTYLLILPAIAMNRPTYCGLEEHTHNEHCAVSELTCGYQEGEITTTTVSSTVYDCDADVHVHDASCRNSAGELVCGYADYVVHKHNSNCYLNGVFVCDLPQIEAHTHDSSCYTTTTTLVCGQEESEGHTHTDECYTTETKTELTCGQEESAGHTHSDACYQNEVDEEGNVIGTTLICGQEESAGHTHSDACYTTTSEQVLTCELEESEGHTHTDECYETEKTLSCGKKEIILHTHGAGCFDQYGNLICTKTEVREHQHDADCYPVVEQTVETPHEHTDVCYTTVYTCNMPEHKHVDDCFVDPNATAEPEATAAPAGAPGMGGMGGPEIFDEYYTPATTGEPETAGEPEATTEPEATVEPETAGEPETTGEPEATTEPETAGEPETTGEPEATTEPETTVEPETTGEPEATVEPEATAEPEAVQGPVLICGKEEHTHVPECYDGNMDLICGKYTHVHSEECYAPMADGAMEGPGIEDGIMPIAAPAGSKDMEPYVKNVDHNGVTYDPLTKEWSTKLTMDFTIPKDAFSDGTLEFDYQFPDGVEIPASLLSDSQTTKTYEDKNGRFTFTFTYEADGTYHVHVKFKQEAVDKLGKDVKCSVSFDAKGGMNSVDDWKDIPFSKDATLEVEEKDINRRSDLSTRKEVTEYDKENNTLTYKVYVESRHGSAGDITLEDALQNFDGLKELFENNGYPDIVKVQKETLDGKVLDDNVHYDIKQNEAGKFTMELPGLEPENGESTRYVITYQYKLKDPGSEHYDVKNTVNVSGGPNSGHGETSYTIEKKMLEKKGWQDGDKIQWEITVNEANVDIKGSKLTDTFFKDHGITQDKVTITPPEGWKWGEDGSLEFTGYPNADSEKNNQKYTIKYTTEVGDGSPQANSVELVDPSGTPWKDDSTVTPGTPGDTAFEPHAQKTYDSFEDAPGGKVVTWTVTLDVPASGYFPAGTKFEDYIGWNNTADHYMTGAQFKELVAKFVSMGLIGENDVVSFTCHSYNNANGHSGDAADNLSVYDRATSSSTPHTLTDDCQIVNVQIDLKEQRGPIQTDANGKLTFSYQTFVPDQPAGRGSLQVRNQFNDANIWFTVQYDKAEKTHDGDNEDGMVEITDDGYLEWKVKVTVGNVDLTEKHSKVVITDQLDGALREHLTLESLTYNYGGGTETTTSEEEFKLSRDNVSVNYDQTSGKTTVTVENPEDLEPGRQLEVTFRFKIDDELMKQIREKGDVRTYEFENKAIVEFDGEPWEDEDTITVPGATKEDDFKDVIGKDAEPTDNHKIHYSLNINPHGLEVPDADGILDLTDELTYDKVREFYINGNFSNSNNGGEYGNIYNSSIYADQSFELIRNSVKLYYAKLDENGKLVKDESRGINGEVPSSEWSWVIPQEKDDGTKVSKYIQLQVPNGTPLILEYDYRAYLSNWRIRDRNYNASWATPEMYPPYPVELSKLKEEGAFSSGDPSVAADNTATLSAWDSEPVHEEIPWEESGAEGSSSTNGLTIHKVDSKNYSEDLEGAEFGLFKVDSLDAFISGDAVPVITVETDEMGEIVVGVETDGETLKYSFNDDVEWKFEPGELYCLMETKAPANHRLPDLAERQRIYLWYPSTDTPMPAGTLRSGDQLINMSLDNASEFFIPNDKEETYVLPETGGSGTLWYTIAGAMIFGFGAVFSMIQRKRLGVGRR